MPRSRVELICPQLCQDPQVVERVGDLARRLDPHDIQVVHHPGAEWRKVLALVQRREIDAVLVTKLSCCAPSATDLLATLKKLEARRVSLIALNGMEFDLTTL